MKKFIVLSLLCGLLFAATNSPPNLFDGVGDTTVSNDCSSFEVKKELPIIAVHAVPSLDVELVFYDFDVVMGDKKVSPHISDSPNQLTSLLKLYFSAIASTKYRRC